MPVSIIRMSTYVCRMSVPVYDSEAIRVWLPQYVSSYICNQMIAGEIINDKWQWYIDDERCVLKGEFACHEMIGQVKFEEIIEQDAKDN